MAHLDYLIEQIQALSVGERRRLLRRLKAMGLLEAEVLLTDREALAIAPAVQRGAGPVLPRKRTSDPQANDDNDGNDGNDDNPARPIAEGQTYRSAVSGKVVVGAPQNKVEATPSIMPPLPGQAPDRPIRIVFDGGSRGNPGQGYGSYALDWPGAPRQVARLQFGARVTNNEAEYDTLIAALESLLQRLKDNDADPGTATVDIWGDSLLVVNQIKGEWRCREPRLQVRLERARSLLSRLGRVALHHHDRENSVAILGH